MLTRQGIQKISNKKTFAISFLCSPSKRRKNEESPIEVSFRIRIKRRVSKNNPFVGLIFAFRDEYKPYLKQIAQAVGIKKP